MKIHIRLKAYEKLYEDHVFNSDGGDLHGNICGGQAELQKDRQKLPDER